MFATNIINLGLWGFGQGYFILNFAILYIYENTLLPALENASLAIRKASKFIAKI